MFITSWPARSLRIHSQSRPATLAMRIPVQSGKTTTLDVSDQLRMLQRQVRLCLFDDIATSFALGTDQEDSAASTRECTSQRMKPPVLQRRRRRGGLPRRLTTGQSGTPNSLTPIDALASFAQLTPSAEGQLPKTTFAHMQSTPIRHASKIPSSPRYGCQNLRYHSPATTSHI